MSASSSTLSPVTVPSLRAASVSRWIWSRPWCAGHDRLGAGLGELHRPAQAPGDQEGHQLLGGELQLAAEAAADVRRDHPDLGLGDPGHQGQQDPQDVRHLGGRPHGDLLTGRVDDGRARLHERRNQPLLAEPPLDHDAVRRAPRRSPPRRRRRCPPRPSRRPRWRCVLVPSSGWTRSAPSAMRGPLDVEDDRQLLVVDVDQVGGVARLAVGPRGDDRHGLAGERHVVDGHAPGARGAFMSSVIGHARGQAALLGVQVGAGAAPRRRWATPWPRRCRPRRSARGRRGCARTRGAACPAARCCRSTWCGR